MLNIAYRNLKIFMRDKATVFFSFLGVIIVIGLYMMFLKNSLVTSINDHGVADMDILMDNWVMAGVVAITSITTTLGSLGIMVEDRAKKNLKDFNSSPIRRYKVAGGYILSTYAIGVILSIASLIFAEIFIAINGGDLLSITAFMKMLGLILLSVLSSSAMMFLITSIFKSQNAFGAASTIVGTLAGFITGVYIPIGQFPEPVQWVIRVFPPTHAAALMRQVMTEVPIENSFGALPAELKTSVIADFKESMGIFINFGDTTASVLTSILIILGSAAVFYLLAVISMSRKQK